MTVRKCLEFDFDYAMFYCPFYTDKECYHGENKTAVCDDVYCPLKNVTSDDV